MEVCILSMQRVPNFGSLLQSYALKKILEQQGHRVSFLDIEENREDDCLLCEKSNRFNQETQSGRTILSKLKKLDKYALNRLRIKALSRRQHESFQEFRSAVLEMDDGANERRYDCCVIGSDEVFNCLAGAPWGFTSQLFGNVRQTDRVITYAASCGATVFEDVPQAAARRIAESFEHVAAFSVRDENTRRFVSQLTKQTVAEHFDPALVYDFEAELDAAQLPQLPERYCIVYSYYNRFHDAADIEKIKAFCSRNHLKIVSVGAPQMWIRDHLVLTPFETLKVFRHAAFVITDTFHGTIFSAKYGKRFAILTRPSNRNKLGDLIERLQLQTHLIQSLDELEMAFAHENDTEKIAAQAERELDRARRYLAQNI